MIEKELVNFIKSFGVNFLKNSFIHNGTHHLESNISLLKKNAISSVKIPKKVWIYWDSLQVPDLIKAIIENNKRKNPTYEFTVLNETNLFDFIPKVDFHKDMLAAHKADYIRLKLLSINGGIWLDATTILIDNLDWVEEMSISNHYDLIGYYRDKSTVCKEFPIVETWFLATGPNNYFINRWLKLFSPIIKYGSKGFFEVLKSRADYKLISQDLSNPAYLMLNMCEQIASRELKDVNMYLKKCEDSAFFIQENCDWDFNRINYVLCRQKMNIKNFPVLKLTSKDRELVEFYSKINLIKRESIIGQILNNKSNEHHNIHVE